MSEHERPPLTETLKNPDRLDLNLAKTEEEKQIATFYNDGVITPELQKNEVLYWPGTFMVSDLPALLTNLHPDKIFVSSLGFGALGEMSLTSIIERSNGFITASHSLRNPSPRSFIITPEARIVARGQDEKTVPPNPEAVLKKFKEPHLLIDFNAQPPQQTYEVPVVVPLDWTIGQINDVVYSYLIPTTGGFKNDSYAHKAILQSLGQPGWEKQLPPDRLKQLLKID